MINENYMEKNNEFNEKCRCLKDYMEILLEQNQNNLNNGKLKPEIAGQLNLVMERLKNYIVESVCDNGESFVTTNPRSCKELGGSADCDFCFELIGENVSVGNLLNDFNPFKSEKWIELSAKKNEDDKDKIDLKIEEVVENFMTGEIDRYDFVDGYLKGITQKPKHNPVEELCK